MRGCFIVKMRAVDGAGMSFILRAFRKANRMYQ
jgi:hypothetical protein